MPIYQPWQARLRPPMPWPIAAEFLPGLMAALNGSHFPEYHRYVSKSARLVRVGRGLTGVANINEMGQSGRSFVLPTTDTHAIFADSSASTNDAICEIPAGSWTFQMRIDRVALAGAASNPGFWRTNATETGTTWCIQQGSTGRPWIRINGVDVLKPATGPTWVAGQTLDLLVRNTEAKKIEVWWNGQLQYSAAHSTAQNALTGSNAIFTLMRQNGSERHTGAVPWARWWARALPDDLIARLRDNPSAFYLQLTDNAFYALAGVGGGGTLYTRTLSATQGQSAAIARRTGLTRGTSQGQSAAVARLVALPRAASQGPSATISRLTAIRRAATQAQAATLSSLKAKFLTLTAAVTTAPSLVRAIAATRGASQASAAVVVRLVGVTRSATQASSASLAVLKARFITLTASVGQTATIVRAVALSRAVAQATAPTLTRLVALTRSAAQTQLATLAVLKARFVTLTASVGQVATLARAVGLARAAAQAQAATVRRAISATRAAAQGQFPTVSKLIAKTLTAGSVLSAVLSWFKTLAGTPTGAHVTLGAVTRVNACTLAIAAVNSVGLAVARAMTATLLPVAAVNACTLSVARVGGVTIADSRI